MHLSWSSSAVRGFLAAALLFTMTFAVNTLAEVIRQRLREKYRAL